MQNSTLNYYTNADLKRGEVVFNGQGVLQALQAGVAGQNVDLVLTDDCYLTGALLRVANAGFGDSAHAQVVLPDGVTVAKQFITGWLMRSDAQEQYNFETSYPAKIPAGFILRAVYNSTGNQPPTVAINYHLHKCLV